MRRETGSPKILVSGILVPRGRAPFGQHQESRPLASSNGIPFLNGFVNTITNQICQTWLWTCAEWREVRESRTSGVGLGQGSRFLVLTKRSASSGHENGSLEIDYSPCLGADQKAHGLWERDCSRSPVFTFASRPGVLSCRVWPSLRVWCAFMSNSGLCFPV